MRIQPAVHGQVMRSERICGEYLFFRGACDIEYHTSMIIPTRHSQTIPSPFSTEDGSTTICSVGLSAPCFVKTFEVPMAAVSKQSHDLPFGVTAFSSSTDGQQIVAFGRKDGFGACSRVVTFHGAETASWEQLGNPIRQVEFVADDEQLLLDQETFGVCVATPNGRTFLPRVKRYRFSPSQTKIAYLKVNDPRVYILNLLEPLDSYSEENRVFVELPTAVTVDVEMQLSDEGDVVAVRHLVRKGSVWGDDVTASHSYVTISFSYLCQTRSPSFAAVGKKPHTGFKLINMLHLPCAETARGSLLLTRKKSLCIGQCHHALPRQLRR